MPWVLLAIGAALSWGLYGPALHGGQVQLGSPFRALLCVGLAYMLIGVLVPVVAIMGQYEVWLDGFQGLEHRFHGRSVVRKVSVLESVNEDVGASSALEEGSGATFGLALTLSGA